MQRKDVILLFGGFDDEDRAAELRRRYTEELTPLVIHVLPKLLEAAEGAYRENGAPNVIAAIIDLPITAAPPLTILTGKRGLSCQPRFGWYDPARDAVMMWLQHQDATDERPATLETLFDRPASTPPAVGIRYYLVFSLSDIRVGSVVDTGKGTLTNGQPEHMSVGGRDEVFEAGGFPKLK